MLCALQYFGFKIKYFILCSCDLKEIVHSSPTFLAFPHTLDGCAGFLPPFSIPGCNSVEVVVYTVLQRALVEMVCQTA